MIGQCVECGDVADSFRLLTWADIVKSYQSKSCTIFKTISRKREHGIER